MFKRVAVLLCIALAGIAGCAAAPQVAPTDPRFPTVSFLKTHGAAGLGEAVLVAAVPGPATRPGVRESLPFRSADLWRYVIRYGRAGNACPDGQLDSDCAHFQAHALLAAGVRVAHPSAACTAGCALRVKDLAIALDNASRRYENVRKFTDYRQARRGDYCFLPRSGDHPHDHLMLLADEPDFLRAKVYSHTNNRNGEYAPFEVSGCLFYRIEDR